MINNWQFLRIQSLKLPVLSAEEIVNDSVIYNFYVELPEKGNKLFYNQEEDYSKVQVGFEKTKELPLTVSAEAAKLDRLMTVPFIRDHFIKENYATEFKEKDFILSPTYFNNIYKGAIGEVVGRLLFKEILDIELDEIKEPVHFELFDFMIKDSGVYIDFKNWHETTVFSDTEMLEKIEKKANACNCNCVIVANILASKKYRITEKKVDGLTIIEIPALLLDNGHDIKLYEDAFEKIRRVIYEHTNKDE